MQKRFQWPVTPLAHPDNLVIYGPWRFTVLTSRLIRMEYDPQGIFEDRPSQTVLFRNFPAPAYTVKQRDGRLEIDTKNYHLSYDVGAPFTDVNLVITAKNGFTHYGATWRFGHTSYSDPPRDENLMGTARTLDKSTGPVLLGEVSQCNDDANDNRFNPVLEGRFPAIEEDEAPYRLLCTEYPAAE